jgi:hypothetical protein
MDVVFPSSSIDPHMKEFGIGISLLDVCNPRTLFLSSSLHHGKRNHLPFQPRAKV